MSDFAITTTFRARDKQMQSSIKKMDDKMRRFGKTADRSFRRATRSGSRFRDVVKGILAADLIKATFRGVGRAVTGLGSMFINSAADVEDANAQFRIMTGSMENAKKVVEDLRILGAKTPFEFKDLADNAAMLLGFGAVTQKNVIPTLRMLGDTAQGNAEKLGSVALAFGQIKAGGRATMQDINQLINAGVPIMAQLAKQWDTNTAAARKMIAAGRATADEVDKAFSKMTRKGGIFFKGMEIASKTFRGLMSTLRDGITMAAANIGEAMLPVVKDLIRDLIVLADKVAIWAKNNQELIKVKVQDYFNRFKQFLIDLKPLIQFMLKALNIVSRILAPEPFEQRLARVQAAERQGLSLSEFQRAEELRLKGSTSLIKIAGAPEGTTAEVEKQGAPPIELQVLGGGA
jgi:tape measure domain-containing protein